MESALNKNGCPLCQTTGEDVLFTNDRSQEDLVLALKPKLGAHAVVLVKGSRSSRMENVVNALVEKV